MNLKLNRLIGTGLLLASVSAAQPVLAATVTYADPVPAGPTYPGCLDPVPPGTGPTGKDGGISYEWTVMMKGRDHAELVGDVGAKSWNEPPPAYEPPYTGWTHTSDWIALDLDQPAKLLIEVERQEGVTFPAGTTIATARNKLVPAISIYKNWDNTSCEDHRYNNAGNDDWSTLEYIGNRPNNGKPVAVYRAKLPAGQYSIAIGGSPKVLDQYPAGNCDAADPLCYAYTGRHGFEAHIATFPTHD